MFESIYNISPIFFQNVMVSIAGYEKGLTRYGKPYSQYRRFLSDFDKWPYDEKVQYQNNELKKFIAFTYKNSPYYRSLYAGINLDTVKTIDDLKVLPIIDKEMLREHIDAVYTIPKQAGIDCNTGGTTGKSLVVRSTKEDFMDRMAILDNFKARVGFNNRKMKRATFNGKPIVPRNQIKKVYWRYNAACKQMIYSTFDINEKSMPEYISSLNSFKPDSIDGFFSSIAEIAGYIVRNDINLSFRPVGIFTTSETVTSPGRSLIENAFGCKLYNQYSSSEGAPFITECMYGNMHLEMASGIVETMNEDNEILVTCFLTHGTPLIRYRIGDCMCINSPERACDCGMTSTMVSNIDGRSIDYLYTADGSKINSVNIANMFKYIENSIVKVQVVQSDRDEVVINIVKDERRYTTNDEMRIRQEFAERFGDKMKLVINYVDDIARTKGGKHQLILNRVKE